MILPALLGLSSTLGERAIAKAIGVQKGKKNTISYPSKESTYDTKLKTTVIQTIHKSSHAYNPDINNVMHHESIPFTREQMSQKNDVTEDREIDAVVNIFNKTYREKGRPLLNLLKPVIAWDPHTLEIIIDEKPLQESDIIDMVSYLILRAKQMPVPVHFERVLMLLVRQNLPNSFLNYDGSKGRAVKAGSTSRRESSSPTISPERSSEQQESPPSSHSPSTFAAAAAAAGACADPAPRISTRLIENAWKIF